MQFRRSIASRVVSLVCVGIGAVGTIRGAGDVIVGEIAKTRRWDNGQGTIAAFSMGTVSCNIGDAPLEWDPETPMHPVIAQNLYRLKNGRLEQLGMSWLKHGFSVVSKTVCGNCPVLDADRLMPSCSDLYDADLNGDQTKLGPRSAVNPATGSITLPFMEPKISPETGAIAGRLQVPRADIDPVQNATALYFLEAEYIHPQDAMAGKGGNNISYRQAFLTTDPGRPLLEVRVAVPTVRQSSALNAWKSQDTKVRIFEVDVPSDGQLLLAVRSKRMDANTLHHEIVVQNVNSDRSVRSLRIETVGGTVSGAGFRDVPYHSGEPFASTDWTAKIDGRLMEWATDSFDANKNANAIRWGTTYSFWFDSSDPIRKATMHLFKPGAPDSMSVDIPLVAETGTVELQGKAAWTEDLAEDIGLGTINKAKSAEFVVKCPAGAVDCTLDLEALKKSFRVTSSKSERNGAVEWRVSLEGLPGAQGYFESVLFVQTGAGPRSKAPIRIFGKLDRQ